MSAYLAVFLSVWISFLSGPSEARSIFGLDTLRRMKTLPARRFSFLLQVGAQRVIPQQGAYTSGIFVGEAKQNGADFALVYHSETRKYYRAEAEESLEKERKAGKREKVYPEDIIKRMYTNINLEVKAILAQGMTPVVCVGETATQKDSGLTETVVWAQLNAALQELSPEEVAKIVVAYEPLWAITGSGSGNAATPKEVQEVHQAIRVLIRERFGEAAASKVRILYGGSTTPENSREFLGLSDVDGLLVGSASANLESFSRMIKITQEQGLKNGRLPFIIGNWKAYTRSDEARDFVERIFEIVAPLRVEVGIAPAATNIAETVQLVKGYYISDIRARIVKDSRGNDTVEAEIILGNGKTTRFIVPAGASKGEREALAIEPKKAKENIENIILPAIRAANISVNNQTGLDKLLIALDGTENKSNLGANAILAVSGAWARAGAEAKGLALFEYIAKLANNPNPALSKPMFNIINGGVHADSGLKIQEFMIIPLKGTFRENLDIGTNVYASLKKILQDNGLSTAVGDEAGFAPQLKNEYVSLVRYLNESKLIDNGEAWQLMNERSSEELAIVLLLAAVRKAGYKPGVDVSLALDVAASSFYNKENGLYNFEGGEISATGMVDFLGKMAGLYPIISIEDGLAEQDQEGWRLMTQRLKEKVQLVGDDIFVTNPRIFGQGISEGIANAILVKLNQIGTVSETLDVITQAQKAFYNFIISHRSGETEDPFIAHLAVGTSAKYIKAGAPSHERLIKYNELLRIEEMLRRP